MSTIGSLTFTQKIERFLFAEEVPYGFALMRMTLPIVLLQGVLARWRFCEDLYSTNGVTVSLAENFHYPNWLQPLPPFPTACLMSLLVALLVTSCVGWYTRFSLLGSFCIHTYFACNDMATSMTKFTVIETHMLLLLGISGCGQIWSVDSWLAARRDPARVSFSDRPAWALSAVWPSRLLMLMIGCTYLGAAITKLGMPEFMTGEAISYWIMSNPNFRHHIAEWMTQYPALLIMSGQFTVLWEVLFLFTAWYGFPRRVMFSLGLFFHFMAAMTLGEVIFFFVMCSSYCGCLTESEARAAGSRLHRIWTAIQNRLPEMSLLAKMPRPALPKVMSSISPQWHVGVFGGLMLTVGIGGAWANYSLDLYGVRRPQGKYTLPEISQEEVARLFVGGEPIREQDKFLGVRVGSTLISGRLGSQTDRFRYGDTIIWEASLNPPHDDMWVECHLLDSENKIINRDGNIAAREHRFTQFKYKLTEALEPGNYKLVLRSRNQVICHRDFTLDHGTSVAENASVSAPLAN